MPEDRDQLFEKALARQLRTGAAESASACLDPETLAAYHERLLSGEEMAAAKDHLVGCASCQEILAELERTQDLAEKLDQAAAVLAPEKPPANVTQLSPRKTTAIRWAAPLGAMAAVLLLWIGVRGFRMPATALHTGTEIADNRKQQ